MTKTTTFTLPSAWASYLINGNAENMEDAEVQALEAWLAKETVGQCLACSDEPFFSWLNDGPAPNIGGDCLEFEFEVL